MKEPRPDNEKCTPETFRKNVVSKYPIIITFDKDKKKEDESRAEGEGE